MPAPAAPPINSDILKPPKRSPARRSGLFVRPPPRTEYYQPVPLKTAGALTSMISKRMPSPECWKEWQKQTQQESSNPVNSKQQSDVVQRRRKKAGIGFGQLVRKSPPADNTERVVKKETLAPELSSPKQKDKEHFTTRDLMADDWIDPAVEQHMIIPGVTYSTPVCRFTIRSTRGPGAQTQTAQGPPKNVEFPTDHVRFQGEFLEADVVRAMRSYWEGRRELALISKKKKATPPSATESPNNNSTNNSSTAANGTFSPSRQSVSATVTSNDTDKKTASSRTTIASSMYSEERGEEEKEDEYYPEGEGTLDHILARLEMSQSYVIAQQQEILAQLQREHAQKRGLPSISHSNNAMVARLPERASSSGFSESVGQHNVYSDSFSGDQDHTESNEDSNDDEDLEGWKVHFNGRTVEVLSQAGVRKALCDGQPMVSYECISCQAQIMSTATAEMVHCHECETVAPTNVLMRI